MPQKKTHIGRNTKAARNKKQNRKTERRSALEREKEIQKVARREIKRFRKDRSSESSGNDEEDTPLSSMVKPEVKNEPVFETVFECVEIQPEIHETEEYLEDEPQRKSKRNQPETPKRTANETEKLEALKKKVEFIYEEIEFERVRGKELEKELEKVNESLKDVTKKYGFDMDCF